MQCLCGFHCLFFIIFHHFSCHFDTILIQSDGEKARASVLKNRHDRIGEFHPGVAVYDPWRWNLKAHFCIVVQGKPDRFQVIPYIGQEPDGLGDFPIP